MHKRDGKKLIKQTKNTQRRNKHAVDFKIETRAKAKDKQTKSIMLAYLPFPYFNKMIRNACCAGMLMRSGILASKILHACI